MRALPIVIALDPIDDIQAAVATRCVVSLVDSVLNAARTRVPHSLPPVLAISLLAQTFPGATYVVFTVV